VFYPEDLFVNMFKVGEQNKCLYENYNLHVFHSLTLCSGKLFVLLFVVNLKFVVILSSRNGSYFLLFDILEFTFSFLIPLYY